MRLFSFALGRRAAATGTGGKMSLLLERAGQKIKYHLPFIHIATGRKCPFWGRKCPLSTATTGRKCPLWGEILSPSKKFLQ